MWNENRWKKSRITSETVNKMWHNVMTKYGGCYGHSHTAHCLLFVIAILFPFSSYWISDVCNWLKNTTYCNIRVILMKTNKLLWL